MELELMNILNDINKNKPFLIGDDRFVYSKLSTLEGVESKFDIRDMASLLLIYRDYSYDSDLKQLKSLGNDIKHGKRDNFCRSCINSFMNIYNNGYPDFKGWIFNSGNNVYLKDRYLKLFISVDNSSLHNFANIFIKKCFENNYMDYYFLINNDESINRRDNVIIYCNNYNFKKFAELANKILEENPEIKVNRGHLLGKNYKNDIYYGVDEDMDMGYIDTMCYKIKHSLICGMEVEDIVMSIDACKEKCDSVISTFIDKIKYY